MGTRGVERDEFRDLHLERGTSCNLHPKIVWALNTVDDFLKHSGAFGIPFDKQEEKTC